MKGKKNYIYNWKKAKTRSSSFENTVLYNLENDPIVEKRRPVIFQRAWLIGKSHVSPHHHKMTHRLEITLPTETNSNLSPAYGHPSNGYKSGLNREFFTGTRHDIVSLFPPCNFPTTGPFDGNVTRIGRENTIDFVRHWIWGVQWKGLEYTLPEDRSKTPFDDAISIRGLINRL